MTDVNILIVDDRPENLVALEAILGSLDHVLVRARSGEDALKALLTYEFALILLDVSMPGMDGFETAARIKRREKTRDIPIIFLTGLSNEPHHAFRGYAVGAVDYLAKPFDPWVLRTKVSVFVDLHLKNRQLQEQARLLRRDLVGHSDGAVAHLATERGAAPGALADYDTTPATALTEDDHAGGFLVADLSTKLTAIEEQVAQLRDQVGEHTAVAAAAAELHRRTERLRATIDALAGSESA